VFRLEFRQELFCDDDDSRRKQPDVQEFARAGNDCGVQPEPLVVAVNPGFAERNVIRGLALFWL
jgi:hypothetical protein